MRRALAIAILAAVLGGCGSLPTATPTPAAMDDVIAALVLRGLTIRRLVGGDPGCPSSDLHSNAVRLEVAIDNRSATHEIYLLRWRRPADYSDSAQAFADCIAEYHALHPGQTVSQLESEPWRAYGPGWPPDLGPRLADALRSVGGG